MVCWTDFSAIFRPVKRAFVGAINFVKLFEYTQNWTSIHLMDLNTHQALHRLYVETLNCKVWNHSNRLERLNPPSSQLIMQKSVPLINSIKSARTLLLRDLQVLRREHREQAHCSWSQFTWDSVLIQSWYEPLERFRIVQILFRFLSESFRTVQNHSEWHLE